MDLRLNGYQSRAFDRLKELLGLKICAALQNPEVEEIILNPDGRLYFIYGKRHPKFIDVLDIAKSHAIIRTVAALCDQEIDFKRPSLNATLPESGARFSALMPPVVLAPCFCIRSHHSNVYSLSQLQAAGMLSSWQKSFLSQAIKDRRSLLICGSTGCGKTTLLNSLLLELQTLSPHERLVSIEDTRELSIKLSNSVSLMSSEHIGMSELVKYSLRLSPSRIIVGEVRGAEALDLVDALTTGHDGSMATLHAGSTAQALKRLCLLVSRHKASPQEPESTVAQALDLIVMLSKHPRRHISSIAAVTDFVYPNFIYSTIGENNVQMQA